MVGQFDKATPAVKPPPKGAGDRLRKIIESDRLAIIVTNLRLQVGIPQASINR